jgi:hypothetical protein
MLPILAWPEVYGNAGSLLDMERSKYERKRNKRLDQLGETGNFPPLRGTKR